MCAIAIVWQDVSTVLTLKTPAILAKHMRKYTIANNGCIDGIYNFCNSLTSVDAAIEEFPKELQVKADPNIPKKCINTSWPKAIESNFIIGCPTGPIGYPGNSSMCIKASRP